MASDKRLFIVSIGAVLLAVGSVNCCRIGSEKLKTYTRESIEYLLDANLLESVYWPEGEPLDTKLLSKATGIDVTLAETRFRLDSSAVLDSDDETSGNSSSSSTNALNDKQRALSKEQLIRDIFVTCSIDRGRSYALSINLELANPFKVVEVQFNTPKEFSSSSSSSSSSSLSAANEEVTRGNNNNNNNKSLQSGLFHIRLPQSTFLVNLKQRVRYDECLTINYVQLAPHSNYEIECTDCSEAQRNYLDKIINKRMTQLESQLDSILSEKLLLGLEALLNQQRLELDLLFLENNQK